MELLFETRREIIGKVGRLTFFQCQGEVSPHPVLQGDTATDALGAVTYGTVIKEGNRFRLWYQAATAAHDFSSDIAYVAYAESDNGIDWVKPEIKMKQSGQVLPGNLTNLSLHSPSITVFPDEPPARRYVATGCCKRAQGIHPDLERNRYYIATSPDGLAWSIDRTSPNFPGLDVITSVYDGRTQKGLAAFKHLRYSGGVLRRSIFTAEFSPDGWGTSRLALMADEADDFAARSRHGLSADYYGMAMMPAGKTGTVGLVWAFWSPMGYSNNGSSNFGPGSVILAYQETPDDRWIVNSGRASFLEPPGGPVQGAFFYTSSSPIVVGNEHWLYVSVFSQGHSWVLDHDRKVNKRSLETVRKEGLGAIHLARWPRDRFCGFRAESEAQMILDLGMVTGRKKLVLNIRVRAGGYAAVQLSFCETPLTGFTSPPAEATPGFSFEDCLPIDGDRLEITVRWNDNSVLPVSENPEHHLLASLRLFLAEIYAYDVVDLPNSLQ